MDISRQKPNIFNPASPLRFTVSFVLLTAGIAAAGMLCATDDYRNAAVVTAVSLGAAFLLAAPVTFEVVLLTWFALTPLASFYLRYPIDRSIITCNRAVFGLLVVMLLLESHRKLKRTGALLDTSSSTGGATFSLSKFEIAWALLSLL